MWVLAMDLRGEAMAGGLLARKFGVSCVKDIWRSSCKMWGLQFFTWKRSPLIYYQRLCLSLSQGNCGFWSICGINDCRDILPYTSLSKCLFFLFWLQCQKGDIGKWSMMRGSPEFHWLRPIFWENFGLYILQSNEFEGGVAGGSDRHWRWDSTGYCTRYINFDGLNPFFGDFHIVFWISSILTSSNQ